MEVWIVNMGLGENVERDKAMRVFTTKEKAFGWVRKHFEDQIKDLDNDMEHTPNGLNIGNSFHIYPMRAD